MAEELKNAEPIAPEGTEQLPEFDSAPEIPDHIAGEPIKAKDQPEQPAPETPQEQVAPSDQAEAEPQPVTPEKPDGYDQAIHVLKRAKFSKGVIEKMTDEEIIEQADNIRPLQAENDRMWSEYNKLVKDHRPDPAQDVQPDLSLFSSEIEQIKSELGDDQAKAFEGILAKQSIQHKNELKELASRIEQMEAVRTQRDIAAARENLLNEFPRIKSNDAYQRVIDRARSLNSTSDAFERYGGDVSTIMREAALLELGHPTTSSKVIDDHANRRVASPRSGGSVPDNHASKTLDQLEYELFNALEGGPDKSSDVARLSKEVKARKGAI